MDRETETADNVIEPETITEFATELPDPTKITDKVIGLEQDSNPFVDESVETEESPDE